MKLSDNFRLKLSVGYLLIYFLISNLFEAGVFSMEGKRIFYLIYLGIGLVFSAVYYTNNKADFLRHKWRIFAMLLMLVASYCLVSSGLLQSLY